MNRPDPSALDYPPGPYGYTQGTVMENIDFVGKMGGAGDYSAMPMQKVSLKDFHNNPSVKVLFLVGAARWCPPCNAEQPLVMEVQNEFGPRGMQVLEVLAEGATRGVPSVENDIDLWARKHDLTVPVVLDPEASFFKYADVSAFPLGMMVRTDTMRIEYMCVGAQCDHRAAAAQLLP